jgi:hypothetical protein
MDLGREAVALLGDEPSPWLTMGHSAMAVSGAIRAAASDDPSAARAALEAADRCIEVGRALGPMWEPTGYGTRGNVLAVFLRVDEAAASYIECVRPVIEDRTFHVHVGAVSSLGFIRHVMGERWPASYERAYQAGREAMMRLGEVVPGDVFDHAAARDFAAAHEAIESWVDSIHVHAPENALRLACIHAGAVACMVGRWARASRLFGAATAEGIVLSGAVYTVYRKWLPVAREHLTPERGRELRDEGRAMPLDEALAYATTWTEEPLPDDIA